MKWQKQWLESLGRSESQGMPSCFCRKSPNTLRRMLQKKEDGTQALLSLQPLTSLKSTHYGVFHDDTSVLQNYHFWRPPWGRLQMHARLSYFCCKSPNTLRRMLQKKKDGTQELLSLQPLTSLKSMQHDVFHDDTSVLQNYHFWRPPRGRLQMHARLSYFCCKSPNTLRQMLQKKKDGTQELLSLQPLTSLKSMQHDVSLACNHWLRSYPCNMTFCKT
jgi:hypothetical protein